jgi:predicted metal-dependent HD superfamily phosphohydrolase
MVSVTQCWIEAVTRVGGSPAEVLSRLLKRERLYSNDPARTRWDAGARRNLAKELTHFRRAPADRR